MCKIYNHITRCPTHSPERTEWAADWEATYTSARCQCRLARRKQWGTCPGFDRHFAKNFKNDIDVRTMHCGKCLGNVNGKLEEFMQAGGWDGRGGWSAGGAEPSGRKWRGQGGGRGKGKGKGGCKEKGGSRLRGGELKGEQEPEEKGTENDGLGFVVTDENLETEDEGYEDIAGNELRRQWAEEWKESGRYYVPLRQEGGEGSLSLTHKDRAEEKDYIPAAIRLREVTRSI
ncbi:hypothetical protein MKZ38_002092 [Zalerion maritima]|uniref:Uncharacterized protein n=1 Tax=Zalerion maritima TaxID=339359 RepID=A0AAD5WRH7_9PEZI|nr:hypothetical protein MKZ38_002092 [Zalerion maritima]